MTVAILRACNLPRAIRGYVPDEWKKRVAGDFLDVNLLFGPEVHATLVADELLMWNLIIKYKTTSIQMTIQFKQYEKMIKEVQIEMKGHDQTIRKAVIAELKRCIDMYHYVDSLISIIKMHDLTMLIV